MTTETQQGWSVVVLGTAQDGGIPHAGCRCPACIRARRESSFRRLVASLALLSWETGDYYLFDATPDLPEQMTLIADWHPKARLAGIFLTHAHIGHYPGLMYLGREAMSTRDVPVYCTATMAAFLAGNAPWSQLVALGNISLCVLGRDTPFSLAADLTVTALPVPHRNEFADTVGYIIETGNRRVLYIPDVDSWAAWDRDLLSVLANVDVALLDGTFFSDGELAARGRDMAEVPHPRVQDTVERILAGRARNETACARVFFTHLNHTNPLLDSNSSEHRWLRAYGFGLATDGETI
ncbi:MAG: MBL fold metallo-hydrolase [Firmicutes bacterium]|nr:MBL fold metallo-hydrolase [Bacillota bacterium]MCL5039707.1 MBL fold metallo-hydrolase [Bacillota bacterium]